MSPQWRSPLLRWALTTRSITDESEDECADEQDDADHCQPQEPLDGETDDGENGPYDEQDDQYGPHAFEATRRVSLMEAR